MKKQTLTNEFEQHNLTVPSNKHEDWLYYDFDSLQYSISQDSNHNQNINELFKGNYMYFRNGQLEKKQLSDSIKHMNEMSPEKNQNSFIEFAKRSAEKQTLTLNNQQEKIRLIYDASYGYASTNIDIQLEDSTIVIERIFLTSKSCIINNYINLSLKNQSNVCMSEINIENEGHILDFVEASLENDCHYKGLNQSYLCNNSRFENKVQLNGETATARLNGLSINGKNKQTFYNTHVFHNVGNNESHQLFKSINQDNALFEYNGKVTVKKDAQQINSYQLNQNILLDEYATIHSRPQLFIDADDVKCSHGSTTGDLNKEELFYLMSRGLDKLSSKKLVLRAFVEEIFQDDSFKEQNKNINNILSKII